MKRSLRVSESSESHKERLAFASACAGDSKRGEESPRTAPPGEEGISLGRFFRGRKFYTERIYYDTGVTSIWYPPNLILPGTKATSKFSIMVLPGLPNLHAGDNAAFVLPLIWYPHRYGTYRSIPVSQDILYPLKYCTPPQNILGYIVPP